MANIDIVIPALAESVTSGIISKWYKGQGEFAKKGELVLDVETDKVNMEIVAPASGTIAQLVKPGDTVQVGQVVGRVSESSEPAATAATPAKPEVNGSAKPEAVGAPASAGRSADAGTPADAGAGTHADEPRATPLAVKLAKEHGIELGRLAGTGAGGRIREQDVLAAVQAGGTPMRAAPTTTPPAPAPSTSPGGPAAGPTGDSRGLRRERMSALRQRVAQRLVEAQHTAAMLTTFNECDMSAVMALRGLHKEAFEKKHGVGLGFMGFFVKAAVNALRQFPAVNASIVPGASGPEIEYHDFCDISVAIGTPKGLVVPVVRDCHKLGFAQIESAIKDLAGRAREGKLTLAELQGGTFTITNGGIYGSLMSTPILNPPQTGILGMHAIKSRAVEHPAGSGQVGIRPMMYLALSYDHRLIDGSEAVQFLVAIKNGIEQPERLMLEL